MNDENCNNQHFSDLHPVRDEDSYRFKRGDEVYTVARKTPHEGSPTATLNLSINGKSETRTIEIEEEAACQVAQALLAIVKPEFFPVLALQRKIAYRKTWESYTFRNDCSFWTRGEEELLLYLCSATDLPLPEIADLLARTETATTARMKKLGFVIDWEDDRWKSRYPPRWGEEGYDFYVEEGYYWNES